MKKSVLCLVAAGVIAAAFMGCSKKESASGPSVAVFVPGIMADSPTYANFAAGVQDGIDEYNSKITDEKKKAKIHIMEAGTNQAECIVLVPRTLSAAVHRVV